MSTKIRKRFDFRPTGTGTSFNPDDPRCVSRTKQSFRKECDINTIMRRYQKTGVLVDPSTINAGRIPQYGDFSSGADFLDVQNRIALARETFATLPSQIRARFDNDPADALDFMADPNNRAECVELGLMAAPEQAAPEVPAAPPEAPVEPPSEPSEPLSEPE